MEKKKPDKDKVDNTKIYETIRDKGFMQDLWLDVLSDLKEKPSYKHLKSMVEKVIASSVENYATKPKNNEERLKTRTTFTDLSIMTYTIDTLISDVLKKKLRDEIKSMIGNVVADHKNRPSSSSSVNMLEEIGEIICNGKTEEHKEPLVIPASKSTSNQDVVNRKSNFDQEASFSKSCYLNKNCSNTSDTRPSLKSSLLKLNAKFGVENSDIDVTTVMDDDADDCSIKSVSSVHTSDLSSFEDDISISSEDEDGIKFKKRVPLKLANDLLTSGKLSELHRVHAKSEKKVLLGSPIYDKKIENNHNQRSSRIRKPNSRYVSEDLVCPMKLVISQNEINMSEKEETDDSKLTDSNRKKNLTLPDVATVKQIERPKVLLRDLFKSTGRSVQVKESSSDESSSSLNDLNFQTILKSKKKRFRRTERQKSNKKQCVLDAMLPNLEKKLQYNNGAPQQTSKNSESSEIAGKSEIKRKRGRPSNNVSELQTPAEEPIQHSVESFSMLEERLCLKDKKENETSPPKNTKSYDASDLYKPRSDFRVFNSSRGSRAFTLFSN